MEVVAAASDVQGPAPGLQYLEAAGAEFTALTDAGNLLGEIFGFKMVPNTYLIDESGRFLGKATKAEAEAWASAPPGAAPDLEAKPAPKTPLKAAEALSALLPGDAGLHALRAELLERSGDAKGALAALERSLELDGGDAHRLYRHARLLLHFGRKEAAAAQLKEAYKRDPESWLTLKQIWAVENPDRFYSGGIDRAWQAQQKQP